MGLHISVQKSLIIFCDHYGPNISNRIKSISFILVPPVAAHNKPLVHKCSSHIHTPIRVRCSSSALFNAAHPAGQPTNHPFQPQIFILCCAIYPDASWDEKMRKINWPIFENLWVNTFKYRSTVNLIWIWGFLPSFSIQFQCIRIDVYEI